MISQEVFSNSVMLPPHAGFMAFQQNFDPSSDGHVAQMRKSNHISQSAVDKLNGCFDCNICLESCQDPVVTLCGHLYCWPCIYEWLQVEITSFESDEHPRCPVCKAYISTSSLVPLYGRGRSSTESEAKKQLDLSIPHRPPALGMNALLAATASTPSRSNQRNNPELFHLGNQEYQPRHHLSHQFSNYTSSIAPPTSGSPVMISTYSPTINMVSEMVFAGMLGSSDANLFAYPHQNSYPFPGNSSPRLRRDDMQYKSLNRLSIFLFCGIAMCLILF